MNKRALWLTALAILACGSEDGIPDDARALPTETAPTQSERDTLLGPFLAEYWHLPIPLQGAPPADFTELEASLNPDHCGLCHPQQYREWQSSFHAAAYSPGLAGQLIEGSLAAPDQLRNCQTCHSPLEEQQPFGPDLQPAQSFDPELRKAGIACASCHVRSHGRFAPEHEDDHHDHYDGPLPHGGYTMRSELSESRFCAQCHQFFDDEGANGKSLENTYLEWQASPQAAEGRHCQSCHMPDRAHTWRGIHDAEMVRSGVASRLVAGDLQGEEVEATLVVENRDVGHAFPSYVTPRVYLQIHQVDAAAEEIADTRVSGVVGRSVDLGSMTEEFDTRILPGESVRLDYQASRAPGSVALVGRVSVDPDYHYRGVFDYLLENYSNPEALRLIAEAKALIADSSYVLEEFRLELGDAGAN